MARSIPEDRFDALVRAATEEFIERGYRHAQMDDIAAAMGLGKATLYGYVEGKLALFDLVVRNLGRVGPVPVPSALPVRAPAAAATVQVVAERMASEAQFPQLVAASSGEECADARLELLAIVGEIYSLMYRQRRAIKLLDRCAGDFPELSELWRGGGRGWVVTMLGSYIERRIASGHFGPVPSVQVAARFVLEAITTWAVHIHWDRNPERITEDDARATVSHFICQTLLARART